MVDPFKIIEKYYDKHSRVYKILTIHGAFVLRKALAVADRLDENVDRRFLKEAAILHDMGIFLTHAPGLDCFGDKPYVQHGYLGGQLLRKHGLVKHARVCERHTGIGLTALEARRLGLPTRLSYLPVTLEEQIICFADKFYSKDPSLLTKELSVAVIRKALAKHGQVKVKKFDEWLKRFG